MDIRAQQKRLMNTQVANLMPSKKLAVPSVPSKNLFRHRITKNIKNFGMQSSGQAPTEAKPPLELSEPEEVELMQRQLMNIFVPFSYSNSSLHPAWHDDAYVKLLSPQIGAYCT